MQLYVYRKVLNPDAIIDFMNSNSVDDREPIKDLHVTVAYSKKEINENSIVLDTSIIEVKNIKSIEKFGDYWVLLLDSDQLQNRFNYYINDVGCSYDFDSYRPHISFSQSTQDLNNNGLDISVLLGPEKYEELKD